MTVTTRTRAQRGFFVANFAEDGLNTSGGLTARTDQVATFSRGGTAGAATAVDSNGRIYAVGTSTPRFHYAYNSSTGLYDSAGVLLEPSRQNLVVQSDAITAAKGWTIGVGVTPTEAFSTCGIVSLTQLAGANVSDVRRQVTLTGDGVKAVSGVVQFDGATGTQVIVFYDGSVPAVRLGISITWAADGTATCSVPSTGTLLRFLRLADVGGKPTYRYEAQTTSCTAANTHYMYANWGGTATSVRIGAVQVEDAAFPSSIIPTTTATVTRSTDVDSWTFAVAPCAMSGYSKFTAGQPSNFDGSIITQIGTDAGARLVVSRTSGAATLTILHNNGSASVSTTVAATTAVGDLIEVFWWLYSTGSVNIAVSINSAAVVTGAASAVNALTTAWGAQAIRINNNSSSTGQSVASYWSTKVAGGSSLTAADLRAL